MTTVTYRHLKSYSGPRMQPLADVVVVGPAARFSLAGVLVDTGADLLQVPASAAIAAGLPLSAGSSIPISTAGGRAYMTRLSGVRVEIEGIPIVTDLLCHPNSASRALLGRQALAALVEFGFDSASWLWR